ncbi:hypothetical protein H6G33_19520 [Calothrix sp. FACHB-1219]|uniref:hypothetical protein n=1 Tax=unclassified Calothrix TaxID=2619626 RepID=UPI001684B142|nr:MULTISPECIES: hypothetical protein [unclassified Calothrix]MBD2207744.1 hypothetical protein [Calothrix sp. FACHB-168]MBD2219213.1 hypothetical protein [Calothrix sp. FACHB-1219]
MKNLAKLATLGVIISPLVAAGIISTTAKAQQESPPGPLAAPNVTLNIQSSAGNCPKTVGLWWLILPYEGGAEHTVIADTRVFADSAKLVSSTKQSVEFVSPLRSDYASCVGKTQSQEYNFYSVQFKNKQAYFRVDLRKINAPAKEITYKTVTASRPYVRWAIAD